MQPPANGKSRTMYDIDPKKRLAQTRDIQTSNDVSNMMPVYKQTT